VFSVTGYYGLFDLGMRSSIVKYIAHYAATKDDFGLARVINTSLFTYSCVAVAPVNNMAAIFLPMSSHFDATREMGQLRRIFVEGNRPCGFVMFPICATLVILGRALIEVWVGPKYVSSYLILLLLLLPKTLYRAQAASNRILFGMARHRPLAVAVILEGVANLILSIVLIRPYGIVGDALAARGCCGCFSPGNLRASGSGSSLPSG
jgi:hypothetical protein